MRWRSMSIVSPFVEALRASRRLAVRPRVAVGVDRRVEAASRRRRPRLPLGVGDEARDRGRDAGRRRGGDRRSRRAGGAARLDVPAPARARIGAAVRAGRADRAAGAAAHLLELRLRRRGRRSSPSAPRCRSPSTSRTSGRAPASRSTARPGSGAVGTLADLLALARELLAPTASPARRSPRRAPCSSPGSTASCPGFGRQEPNDWGLGLELRDGKSPHWTGSRNSPRDLRPLRPQRHVPLGRSGRRRRARLPHRPRLRRLGGGGVAAARRRRARGEFRERPSAHSGTVHERAS